ncbi:MAG: pyrimidine 5'-nucleotidase [Geothermobacteraceae bacterium]
MKAILFDLDNTLYPPERDLFSLIDVRINRYMEEVVGIAADRVDGLRRRYWRDYGATLQGLVRHYRIDPEDYLHYVHDVDVAERLDLDAELADRLAALPVPCFVFTNGSSDHAGRVLDALGIAEHFDGIFDIRIANYQPKPNLDPYQGVLKALELPAGSCVMVEDSLDNLRTAKQLGMKTVLVGVGPAADFVDHHTEDILEAAGLLEHLHAASAGTVS